MPTRNGTERLLHGMTPADRRYWRRHLADWNAPLRSAVLALTAEDHTLAIEQRSGVLRPPGGTRLHPHPIRTRPLPAGVDTFIRR